MLLDYLIAHGDADFDGFVFNSPFLSWGWDLDGALFKAAMSVAPQVDRLLLWWRYCCCALSTWLVLSYLLSTPRPRVASSIPSSPTFLMRQPLPNLAAPRAPPAPFKRDRALGRRRSVRVASQRVLSVQLLPGGAPALRGANNDDCHRHTNKPPPPHPSKHERPPQVPLTIGFCCGVNRVHQALARRHAAGNPVTLKPFLVIVSHNDEVLDGDDTLLRAHAIGPSRTLVELTYASHDVFASQERETVDAALGYLRTWLQISMHD